MLPGQNRGSKCTAAAAPARISTVLPRLLSRCCLRCLGFVSVLPRFCLGVVSPRLPQTPYHPTGGVIGIYRSLGEGCPNRKFSEERCVCVRARGLCDGEVADARWANPGLRVYCSCFCSCCCPDLGLGFVSVLSRFCLGVVSPHLPQTPYHPTGGVIGIYIYILDARRGALKRPPSRATFRRSVVARCRSSDFSIFRR